MLFANSAVVGSNNNEPVLGVISRSRHNCVYEFVSLLVGTEESVDIIGILKREAGTVTVVVGVFKSKENKISILISIFQKRYPFIQRIP